MFSFNFNSSNFLAVKSSLCKKIRWIFLGIFQISGCEDVSNLAQQKILPLFSDPLQLFFHNFYIMGVFNFLHDLIIIKSHTKIT